MYNKKKKVVFESDEDLFVNFKNRLDYDKIRQKEFFNYLMECYIMNDKNMIEMIDKLKASLERLGKKKIKNATNDVLAGQDLIDSLGLTEKEKNDIFDLIGEYGEDEF
tara:strand:+ start:56 stop:379 length:324 start_codon:yes stop_codon:yes gene_type:complete